MFKKIAPIPHSLVQTEYVTAWNAVPEPYKTKTWLTFFVNVKGTFCVVADGGGNSFTEFQWDECNATWMKVSEV